APYGSEIFPLRTLLCRSAWCYGQYMTETISQRELRNESGRIMRALDEGETFVITSNSQPVGELRPLRKPRFARKEDLLATVKRLPKVDFEKFRADIDEYVDQRIDPRD
ncbi:type II toxin-antitoxin system Phd/YefM family antitoxin, partial [Corynebacterium coyleae]